MGDKREPEQVCSLADDFHGRAIRAEHRVAELEVRVATLIKEQDLARERLAVFLDSADKSYCDAVARAEAAEREVAILREALQWIVDHARDEEALMDRSACGDMWHRQRQWDDGTCPTCCSPWWALDGSAASEEGSYAMEAVARAALAGAGRSTKGAG